MPDVLFSSEGLALSPDGLSYDITNGLLLRILTGVGRRHGFTPIQHISGAEVKTWHSFSLLLAPFGAVLAFGVTYFFSPGRSSLIVNVGIAAVVGLLLLILWAVIRTTRLVVYSDGSLFIAAHLSKKDAEDFMAKYRMLKRSLIQRRQAAA